MNWVTRCLKGLFRGGDGGDLAESPETRADILRDVEALVDRISRRGDDFEDVFEEAVDLFENRFVERNRDRFDIGGDERAGKTVLRLRLKTQAGKKKIDDGDLNVISFGKNLGGPDGPEANPTVRFPETDGLLDDTWLMVQIGTGSTLYCTYVRGRKRCYER